MGYNRFSTHTLSLKLPLDKQNSTENLMFLKLPSVPDKTHHLANAKKREHSIDMRKASMHNHRVDFKKQEYWLIIYFEDTNQL
jgi:hypothetical protein